MGVGVTVDGSSPGQVTGSAQAVVLEVLRHGPLTRAELSNRLGLSPASLTRLTAPLVEAGLLTETAARRPAGAGRPSRPLEIVPDACHFAGVKLTEDESYCVLTNLRADVVAATVTPLSGAAPDAVVAAVAGQLAKLDGDGNHPVFLGVSLGGDTRDQRTVSTAPFLGWRDVPLADLLEEATRLPTVVDNDLVALTKGEHWFGAGRGRDRFVLLTIGAGVGYGLVMHDEVVQSPDTGVGPLGHVPLDTAGPRCFLGHRGCATAMLTIPAITAAVSVGLGREVEYDESLTLASAGDPVAAPIIRDAGAALGRLVATVSTVTMCSHVIVAGDGVRLADLARDSVAQAMSDYRDPRADPVSLEVQTFGFTEWARAAAASAIQKWAGGPVAP